jgi:hypothetical protein
MPDTFDSPRLPLRDDLIQRLKFRARDLSSQDAYIERHSLTNDLRGAAERIESLEAALLKSHK